LRLQLSKINIIWKIDEQKFMKIIFFKQNPWDIKMFSSLFRSQIIYFQSLFLYIFYNRFKRNNFIKISELLSSNIYSCEIISSEWRFSMNSIIPQIPDLIFKGNNLFIFQRNCIKKQLRMNLVTLFQEFDCADEDKFTFIWIDYSILKRKISGVWIIYFLFKRRWIIFLIIILKN
jgi:hypothetical protein